MADAEPYRSGKMLVVFLDGKVEHLKPEELDALIPSGANHHLDSK